MLLYIQCFVIVSTGFQQKGHVIYRIICLGWFKKYIDKIAVTKPESECINILLIALNLKYIM